MSAQIILVGKLFLIMGAGIVLRKTGVVPESGKDLITDLVIDLILPCNIIVSFMMDVTAALLRQTAGIFIISVIIQIISYLFGLVAYRHSVPEHKATLQYATICSNSGILGTPVAEGIFGAEGTLLAAVFLIPLRVVMWTLGISFFTRKKGKFSLKKIITHPCIFAVIVGLIIMITQIRLPELITQTLTTIGNCNTGMSMMLVGFIIADMDIHLLFHRDTIYISVVRLLVMPLIVLLLCRIIPVTTLVRNVSVVLTAMPAGATTSILALKYGGKDDSEFASACIAVTTILSLAVLPVWCAFLL